MVQPIPGPPPPAKPNCRASALRAVSDWARAKGYELRLRHETQGHVLVRQVDPRRDVFYVGNYEWEQEVSMLGMTPDDDETHDTNRDIRDLFASIERLAMPVLMVEEYTEKLNWVLQMMSNLKSVFLVWEELPKMLHTTKAPPGGTGQPRWEAEVQPRYELERLGSERDWPDEERRIEIASDVDKHVGWIRGSVYDSMMEFYMGLSTEERELPETVWDDEVGDIVMDFAPVRVITK